MAKIIRSKLLDGTWRAEVSKLMDPKGVQAQLREQAINNIVVTQLNETIHLIEVPIPVWVLSDGAHSIIVSTTSGEDIGTISIIAGTALADDLRSEVNLLRDELDMLKKAYRKQFLALAKQS